MANFSSRPRVIRRNLNDRSTRQVPPSTEVYPQHLPWVMTFAKKGKLGFNIVNRTDADALYGADTFSYHKKWCTPATALLSQSLFPFNSRVGVQRIAAGDYATATLRYSIEVVAGDVPLYQRNEDGSILIDSEGNRVTTGETTAGVFARWVVGEATDGLGGGVAAEGTMVQGSTQSMRYPMFDITVPSPGEHGNGNGVNITVPYDGSPTSPLDVNQVDRIGARTFDLRLGVNDLGQINYADTLDGDRIRSFSLMPDAYDEDLNMRYYLGWVVPKSWNSGLGPNGEVPVEGPFEDTYVYDDNVLTVLNMMYQAEIAADDTTVVEQDGGQWMIDPFLGLDLDGHEYIAVSVLTEYSGDTDTITFGQNSVHYAMGGDDGDTSWEAFCTESLRQISNFGDLDIHYLNEPNYPLNMFYDVGYPTEVKNEIFGLMGKRSDVIVTVSTHTHDEPTLTAAEESSMLAALKVRASMYMESEYFNTGACRCFIVMQSGEYVTDAGYNYRVPLSFDLCAKFALAHGAGDGYFNNQQNYTESPNNEITLLTNLNMTYKNPVSRERDWTNGGIWAERKDRRTFMYPSIRSIYDDQTSVMTNARAVFVLSNLQREGFAVWASITGNDNLTNAELIDTSNRRLRERTEGRYGSGIVVEPDTLQTPRDLLKGGWWTTNITFYANPQRTANTLIITSRRMEDLNNG